ncbi:hypothetical protein AT4G20703 [Arabidopsis thaliana]|uniref:Uncharacterized protein n=1 Tax=Arabidopsis thaliana TaxID=3702 RepID=A0A1P8B781_ARATH|nr:uncharacterized protein AT4G20703 [Arabidopsis thaliana]ANM67453.1 hypothetical protein AT4G20703 [Arabidopsis thaliana]|eukprot:NP_001329282.1 hypothetical protein AT4G20703 [Arabidopsis thaliana]
MPASPGEPTDGGANARGALGPVGVAATLEHDKDVIGILTFFGVAETVTKISNRGDGTEDLVEIFLERAPLLIFSLSVAAFVVQIRIDESLRSWNLYIGETRGIAIALK